MTSTMSSTARQQFLSDLHVGIISITSPTDDRGPLTLPIWYRYHSDVGVTVLTGRSTHKGVALHAAGRFSLVAQTEEVPYKYVSVEGPVVEVRSVDYERDLLPMAVRYLGADHGTTYAENWRTHTTGDDHVYVMRPERWSTADLTAELAGPVEGPDAG